MKKIFIICPVRIATAEDVENLEAYTSRLEADGNRVHLPHRDTKQTGTSLEINLQNFNAIKEADEVHIFYNNKSQGIHFDLGVCFALGKKIKVIQYRVDGMFVTPETFVLTAKSYQRFLHEYETVTSNNYN